MTTANDRALDRRTFVVGGVAALAAPLAAEAQQSAKIPRVGYLFSFTRTGGEHLWDACREGLRELGYVEGRDMVLEPRWADGQHERLPRLVAELVRAKVDVIVAAATPANLAAKAGASTTPIVMVAVADPVGAGLIASLARPGGTVTGLSLLTPDLSGKRLALLLEVLPRNAKRIAVLTNLVSTTEATRCSLEKRPRLPKPAESNYSVWMLDGGSTLSARSMRSNRLARRV
jgi:putative ABC transport system substrate-binding protein